MNDSIIAEQKDKEVLDYIREMAVGEDKNKVVGLQFCGPCPHNGGWVAGWSKVRQLREALLFIQRKAQKEKISKSLFNTISDAVRIANAKQSDKDLVEENIRLRDEVERLKWENEDLQRWSEER